MLCLSAVHRRHIIAGFVVTGEKLSPVSFIPVISAFVPYFIDSMTPAIIKRR
jgi:hypothetical protein